MIGSLSIIREHEFPESVKLVGAVLGPFPCVLEFWNMP